MQADVFRDVREVGDANLELRRRLRETFRLVERLRGRAEVFSGMAQAARNNAGAISRALDDLGGASHVISSRITDSSATVDAARDRARRAREAAALLRDSIVEIGDVVNLISSIARQTNLLALNATIEAARAGEAGRGFAVVAQEVKALSVATQEATSRIASTIDRVRANAVTSMEDVGELGEAIVTLRTSFQAVVEAVSRQVQTTVEIGRSAAEAAAFAEEVNREAETIEGLGAEAAGLARDAEGAADRADATISLLNDHASILVRQADTAQIVPDRLPLVRHATLTLGGRTLSVSTGNVSADGAFLLTAERLAEHAGEAAVLTVPGLGQFEVRIVSARSNGIAVRIVACDETSRSALETMLERLSTVYAPLVRRCGAAASELGTRIDDLLARGEARVRDVFRDGGDAAAWTGGLAAFGSASLSHAAAGPPDVLVAGLLDRNAVPAVPCHRGHGAVVTPLQHQVLADVHGLAAARNLRPSLIQSYGLPLPDGTSVAVVDVSAPVFVGGRHWGCLRLVFTADQLVEAGLVA
ncbi:methyl-accepting chemotaxis protein [Alsobacter sp. R-9]